MQIVEYEKLLSQSNVSPLKLYPYAEAFSVYFLGTSDKRLFRISDKERPKQLTNLIGALMIDVLNRLDTMPWVLNYPHPLFDGGPLKNIGMIMGEMCRFAEPPFGKTWLDNSGVEGLKQFVAGVAERRGVGMKVCERDVVEYKVEKKESAALGPEELNGKLDFGKLFASYKELYPECGESKMDIMEKSKEWRKEHKVSTR